MDKYNFILNLLKFSDDMIGFLVFSTSYMEKIAAIALQVLNGMLDLTLHT